MNDKKNTIVVYYTMNVKYQGKWTEYKEKHFTLTAIQEEVRFFKQEDKATGSNCDYRIIRHTEEEIEA